LGQTGHPGGAASILLNDQETLRLALVCSPLPVWRFVYAGRGSHREQVGRLSPQRVCSQDASFPRDLAAERVWTRSGVRVCASPAPERVHCGPRVPVLSAAECAPWAYVPGCSCYFANRPGQRQHNTGRVGPQQAWELPPRITNRLPTGNAHPDQGHRSDCLLWPTVPGVCLLSLSYRQAGNQSDSFSDFQCSTQTMAHVSLSRSCVSCA
jgi:hypothetical protein